MTTETTAWLIALFAGLISGVIAGCQQHVNGSAVVAIACVVAIATSLEVWILRPDIGHAHGAH
jgi:hypothetical protein